MNIKQIIDEILELRKEQSIFKGFNLFNKKKLKKQ